MMPDPFSQGGYTCPQCQQWVPYNSTHVCPGMIPQPWPAPMQPAPMPMPQWDFSYKPTQREYFAARAMQALATSTSNGWADPKDAAEIGRRAVAIADGLIAALASKPKGNE